MLIFDVVYPGTATAPLLFGDSCIMIDKDFAEMKKTG